MQIAPCRRNVPRQFAAAQQANKHKGWFPTISFDQSLRACRRPGCSQCRRANRRDGIPDRCQIDQSETQSRRFWADPCKPGGAGILRGGSTTLLFKTFPTPVASLPTWGGMSQGKQATYNVMLSKVRGFMSTTLHGPIPAQTQSLPSSTPRIWPICRTRARARGQSEVEGRSAEEVGRGKQKKARPLPSPLSVSIHILSLLSRNLIL
jgi:hypothetical protein